jgi:hypothetical protein
MNIPLIRKLISNGILRQNTEIEATYKGIDISGRAIAPTRGTFFLRGVKINEERQMVFFDTISTVDGHPRKIMAEEINSIDGMPIDRLASIYGISATGGHIDQGKRRGRRPRAKIAAVA